MVPFWITAYLKGETLIAPARIDYELANIAVTKLRRHPEHQVELLAALELARHFPVTRVDVSPFDAVALAVETGLSAYDAIYLWLALAVMPTW